MLSRIAQPIKTDVLIVGGSYAGLSALVTLKNRQREIKGRDMSVALIEPKAGLLNVLGIPRALVDHEFAKTQFVPFEKLQGISFDKVLTEDAEVRQNMGRAPQHNASGFHVTFIQGKANEVRPTWAQYSLSGSGHPAKIEFKYCIIAAGRDRRWPTTPAASKYESYLAEMARFNKTVEQCKHVSVVGAGAVGIEVAGEIKHRYPEIEVSLFHPHATFPPELLSAGFGQTVRDSLVRAGVKVHTGVRIKSEADGVLETTDGRTFRSDYTYWCTGFRNNTGILGDGLSRYISPNNNVCVNERLQLQCLGDATALDHIYCVGDMMEMPGIKLAGLALYSGRQAANDVVSRINNAEYEDFHSLRNRPPGMAVVCGGGDIVSEIGGRVELNAPCLVEEYRDHRLLKVRSTLGA